MLRKILIFILRFLIGLLFLTFVFSFGSAGTENTIKSVFRSIYDYASTSAQNDIVSKVERSCSSADRKGQSVITGIELCNNESKRKEIEDSCKRYHRLRNQDKIKKDNQTEKTCDALEQGKLDGFCSNVGQSPMLPDFKGMQQTCSDYRKGKLEGRDLFVSFVSDSFGTVRLTKLPFIKNYESLFFYFDYKVFYAIVFMILLALMFFLVKDFAAAVSMLSGILLSTALFFIVPYFLILAYDSYVGIDTTSLLNVLSEETEKPGPEALIQLLVVTFLSLYSKKLLAIAVVLLVLGFSGKIYAHIAKKTIANAKPIAKRKNKPTEPTKSKKAKSPKKK